MGSWKPAWKPNFQKSWDNQGSKGNGKGNAKHIQDPSKTVWIGNVPAEATYQNLLELGKQAGNAKWAEVFKNNTAAIGYATAAEATQAIAVLNGARWGNVAITTDAWEKKSGGNFAGKGRAGG